jgi:hypothetical protein
MINNLVSNGCSYMFNYTQGGGHTDLAARLGMTNAQDICVSGSANTRILRTTLKHSYAATEPTFYLLGMTFVSRGEIPILTVNSEGDFEGRWTNPQNQVFENRWEHFWSRKETEKWVDMKRMTEAYSLLDRTEDLMYSMLACIDSLHRRGHQVLMYQQADDSYQSLYNDAKWNPARKLDLFASTPCIVDKFRWCAIKYQHEQGVAKTAVDPTIPQTMIPTPFAPSTPEHQRKPEPGAHDTLNEFLASYIREHNLI